MPSHHLDLPSQPTTPNEESTDPLRLNSSGSMNKDDWKGDESDRASPASADADGQPTAPASPTSTPTPPTVQPPTPEPTAEATTVDSRYGDDDVFKNNDKDEPLTMTTYMVVPPDGGWGWVIVAASFVCNMVVDGIVFTFGMLVPELEKEFQVPSAQVALVGALQSGFYLMAGPFVSALANRYGFRLVTIIGAILGATGFALSSQATSVQFLFVTFGMIGGTGFGMIYVPAVITTGFYFERWRAMATGIAVCGSGIGTFLMAPLWQVTIAQLGWKGTMLVQAGMVLSCALFGALFRPLKPTKVEVPYDPAKAAEQEKREEVDGEEGLPLLERIKIARDQMRAESTVSLHDPNVPANNNTSYPTATQILGSSTRVLKSSCLSLDVTVALKDNNKNSNNVNHLNRLNGDLTKSEKRLSAPIRDVPVSTPPSSPRPQLQVPDNRRGSVGFRRARAASESAARKMPLKTPSARPMYRDDIFFGASLQRLPQYGSKVSALDYTMSVTRLPTRADLAEESEQSCRLCPEAVRRTLYTMLDLSLLRSPTFLLLAMSGFFTMMGFYVPFTFLKDRAVEASWNPDTAVWLVSSIGITNTIARVVCGVLTSMPGVDALFINNVAITLGGLGTIVSGLSLAGWFQFSYGVVFGVAIACFASLRSILVVDLLGLEKLTNAFGLLLLFQGVAACMGTPIAGAFRDATGSYDFTFYLAGALILLSAIMCYPLKRINEWEKSRDSRNSDAKVAKLV